MPTFEERFRKVADWCGRNGQPAGYPNCHENTGVTPAMYGTIVITQGVSWQDVPVAALGRPNSARTRLTSAHDWAKTQGAAHGFPTFHEANHGAGVVYGVHLLTAAAVGWQDVPVQSILGNNIDPTTRPLEEWFRGAHDWAAGNGRPAAMPNGHYTRNGGTWVMGIFAFNAGFAQWRDLSGDELGFPRNLKVGGGW